MIPQPGKHLSVSEKLFAATRTDGLGGRLRALINAKYLANQTGGRFGFTWNESEIADKDFHHVDVASAIFDSAFLEKHYLGEHLDLTGFVSLGRERYSVDDLKFSAEEDDLKGWICNDFGSIHLFRARRSSKVKGLATAFGEIGFAGPISDVIENAKSVRMPKRSVALHLRSGDIVYGRYRMRQRSARKVIPSALAKAIVGTLQKRDTQVILFGEDRDTLNYLKSQTGCLLVDDLDPPPRDAFTRRVFFEMLVMSRCAEIYAGSSLFADIASRIGSVPLRPPHKLLEPANQTRELLRELQDNGSNYHPREAAFGYFSAYLMMERSGSGESEKILQKAFSLDPENAFYPLKLASFRFKEKRYREGDAILSQRFNADSSAAGKNSVGSMQWMARQNPDGTVDWENDLPLFVAAANAGMPYAAAFCAVLFAEIGDMNSASDMASRALGLQPQNPLFIRVKKHAQYKARVSSRSPEARIWRNRRAGMKDILRETIIRWSRLIGIASR